MRKTSVGPNVLAGCCVCGKAYCPANVMFGKPVPDVIVRTNGIDGEDHYSYCDDCKPSWLKRPTIIVK